MILAEQLILLALEPERGSFAKGIATQRLRRGAAGAILAEMTLHKRVSRTPDGLALADPLPDFHPLLGEGTALLARGARHYTVENAIHRIEHGVSGLLDRLLRSLAARDILHDEREAFVMHRYPVRSMQALREVFDHVHAVEAGVNPQRAEIALAAVADGCGVLDVRLSTEERFRVRRHIDRAASAAEPGASTEDLLLIIEISRAVAEA